MKMRLWLILPVVAVTAIGGMAVLASQPERVIEAKRAVEAAPLIHLAAVQSAEGLSDACVWSPELAVTGDKRQCDITEAASLDGAARAGTGLVWPDDFIELTADAAEDVWDSAVALLSDIYEFAFSGEKPDPASGA